MAEISPKKERSDRRSFVSRLLKLGAAAGVAGVLLSESPVKPVIPNVDAVSGTGVSGQLAYWTNSGGTLGSIPGGWNDNTGSLALGNFNTAGGYYSIVGGGLANVTSADRATVCGGNYNEASGVGAIVGGGGTDGVNYSGNVAAGAASTVGGGLGNVVSGNYATVAGGASNKASAAYATIAGGISGRADGDLSTVGGGANNSADGVCATVGGGDSNTAGGSYSSVPSGFGNTAAGDHSFAAGTNANILWTHHGAMLFSDDKYAASGVTFNSKAPDEFAVRALGGARFVTSIDTSGNTLTQMTVNASGSLGVKNLTPQFDLHVVGTTDPASVTVDGIGIVGPNFQFRRARGTAGSPSAIMSGGGILFLVGKGYGATGFSAGGRANLSMYATQNWTDTAQGTYMTFKTTASGTTNQTEKMRITDTGNILPPSDNTGNIGISTQRWALVRAATITPGDLVFENGIRATEEGGDLAFKNDSGEEIAVLDRKGNFYIRGDVRNLKDRPRIS